MHWSYNDEFSPETLKDWANLGIKKVLLLLRYQIIPKLNDEKKHDKTLNNIEKLFKKLLQKTSESKQ